MSRSTAILVWVASLLLLTWITLVLRHGPIESDLAERVGQALESRAVDGVAVLVDGRDIALRGELPVDVSPAYVADIARNVWGVRAVDADGVTQSASAVAGDDPLTPQFDATRIVQLGGNLSNPMDANACQRTLARLSSVSAIRFESGGASPMLDSYPVLNDMATVAYQCPDARIVIGGHTDASGDREFNLQLSAARAKAVEAFFRHAGIAQARMQTVAHGDSQPLASNATAEGRAANRRITFDIVPFE